MNLLGCHVGGALALLRQYQIESITPLFLVCTIRSTRSWNWVGHAILKSHPSAAHALWHHLRLLFCGDSLRVGRA
jgi:hypothetical protein